MVQLGDEGSQIAATLAGRYPGPQTAWFMLTMARIESAWANRTGCQTTLK